MINQAFLLIARETPVARSRLVILAADWLQGIGDKSEMKCCPLSAGCAMCLTLKDTKTTQLRSLLDWVPQSQQHRKLMKIQIKNKKTVSSAGKRGCPRRDWVSVNIRLVERVVWVFWTNYKAEWRNTNAPLDFSVLPVFNTCSVKVATQEQLKFRVWITFFV